MSKLTDRELLQRVAQITPEEEEELMQWLLENVKQAPNILVEPIPQRLPNPITPTKAPLKPQRSKKDRRRQDVLRNFDPIQPTNGRGEESYRVILARLLGRREGRREGQIQGRRFIFWRRSRGLDENQTDYFMQKIRRRAQASYYMRHNYSYWLENTEDGTIILFYKNSRGSPWIRINATGEDWLREKEVDRLNIDTVERQSTRRIFKGFSDVDVKIVFNRQPLLGTGPLPEWLR